MEKNNKPRGFLPNYFKWVGCVISLIAIAFVVIIKTFATEFNPVAKVWIKSVDTSFFILGLLFVVLSKDKIEDERTYLLKLEAMRFAFMAAALSVIIIPLTNLIFDGSIINIQSQELITSMLFVYIIYYRALKKSR